MNNIKNNIKNDTKIVKLTWDKKIITCFLFCTSIFMAKVCRFKNIQKNDFIIFLILATSII